jgi:hypothetical protein
MTDFRFGRNVRPNDRPAVCWYHPAVLLLAARDVLSSLNQFRNRDERENFPLPLTVIDRSQRSAELGDFWFDFIADTGDGGNATYAVAHTVLADQVVAEGGQVLPRGELLVLGGDLAYPSASTLDYRYRFTELFEAALPDEASYNEAGTALVRGQPVTQRIGPEDRVILLYPEPIWTTPVAAGVHPGGAKRYQLLEGLLQSRIAVRLRKAGHSARSTALTTRPSARVASWHWATSRPCLARAAAASGRATAGSPRCWRAVLGGCRSATVGFRPALEHPAVCRPVPAAGFGVTA